MPPAVAVNTVSASTSLKIYAAVAADDTTGVFPPAVYPFAAAGAGYTPVLHTVSVSGVGAVLVSAILKTAVCKLCPAFDISSTKKLYFVNAAIGLLPQVVRLRRLSGINPHVIDRRTRRSHIAHCNIRKRTPRGVPPAVPHAIRRRFAGNPRPRGIAASIRHTIARRVGKMLVWRIIQECVMVEDTVQPRHRDFIRIPSGDVKER